MIRDWIVGHNVDGKPMVVHTAFPRLILEYTLDSVEDVGTMVWLRLVEWIDQVDPYKEEGILTDLEAEASDVILHFLEQGEKRRVDPKGRNLN